MEEELVTLQITSIYRDKLRELSQKDIRSMKGEFEWLVDQEYARRYSQPNPLVTVAEAQAASETK